MNLRDYVAARMEMENRNLKNPNLRFETPSTADEIVNLYRTYDGMRRHMRALSPDKVQEYNGRRSFYQGVMLYNQ